MPDFWILPDNTQDKSGNIKPMKLYNDCCKFFVIIGMYIHCHKLPNTVAVLFWSARPTLMS